MRYRLLTLLTLFALILTACGSAQRDSSGEIVEAGTEDVFSLRVGDCFDDDLGAEGEIFSVAAVPCDEPHDNEIFYAFDLPAGDYPGDVRIDEAAFAECTTSFETYVGIEYAASELAVTYLSPTPDSWDAGDREIACLLYDATLAKITGTMNGARI